MIICICHNVSDRKIKEVMQSHAGESYTLKDLKKQITVCQQCGKCKDEINELIKRINEK